jgi:ankyrin repeat protein
MGSLRSLRRKEKPVKRPRRFHEDLVTAVRFGTIKNVEALLERGMNPNALDERSGSALHWAAYLGKFGMTRILVKYGADVNQKDLRGHAALENGIRGYCWDKSEKIAMFLLDHGADVNSVDADGQTTLMCAIAHKRFDFARILVERGADPNRRNRDWKRAVNLIGHGRGSKALRKMLKKIS